MLKRIWLALLLVLITACSSSVKSVKTEQNQVLAPNEGYLLLSVNSNIQLDSMKIFGAKTLFITKEDLKAGANYILLPVPAGDYRLAEVDQPGMYYTSLNNEKGIWSFTIEAGKINYVGNFTFESYYVDNASFTAFLENRGSEGFKYMQEKFPSLLKQHSMRFAGNGDDFFFQYIQELTAGAKP